MRPMAEVLIPALLVGCFVTAVAVAREQESAVVSCGPYANRWLTPEKLAIVLSNHQAWLPSSGKLDDQRRANLCQAHLREASLTRANLQRASLLEAALGKANFEGANLTSIRFLLGPGPFPDIRVLAHADNLMEVPDGDKPRWVELREAFKKAGFRDQERQVTYAIKREERLQAGAIESTFHFVLFELPSGNGMAPGRALQTFGLLIVLFSVPYMVAVTTRREAGIWMVWLPDRVHKGESDTFPVRVTPTFFFSTCQK